jgi:anaerobic selenocysteine-containing dehydrogenase
VDEYYQWIFENSVPGLPKAAAEEGLSPLAYMRKYAAFEVLRSNLTPYEKRLGDFKGGPPDGYTVGEGDVIFDAKGKAAGLMVDGESRVGFGTPSRKLEFFSATLSNWGWSEHEYVIPWPIKSHVHPDNIDRSKGEMLLLPNFRLPTLIHTRSANAKWLYEISHKNPVWMHPGDAKRIGVETDDLVRIQTEIGYFVDKAWVTEGIKPGVVAVSHHLGRWRLTEGQGLNKGMSNLAEIDEEEDGLFKLTVLHGATSWETFDPDTSRIWWNEVGVHQNLTHGVHPDPISGGHCWLQKAYRVEKAHPGDRYGDVWVDTNRSMEVYREWVAKARSAVDHSPDGLRRPTWLQRPLSPVREAYQLPEHPFGFEAH